MCSTTPNAGRVHQHAKTVLSASISAAAMPGNATPDDIYRLLVQNRELLLALSETLISRASAVVDELDDKPLRTSQTIEEAGLSRTVFYDLRNPKHEKFDDTFPLPFVISGCQFFWRSQIKAWVKAQAAKAHSSNAGGAP